MPKLNPDSEVARDHEALVSERTHRLHTAAGEEHADDRKHVDEGKNADETSLDSIPAVGSDLAFTDPSKASSTERNRVSTTQPAGNVDKDVPGRTRLLAKTSPYADLPSRYVRASFRKVASPGTVWPGCLP
jgi:hypothetical protein